MNKLLVLIALLYSGNVIFAQPGAVQSMDTSWKKEYRETAARINDLVHTKLEVKPDFSKSYLYGKAWLTLKPHFYPTDTLTLDAKGMEIKKLTLLKNGKHIPLKY